MTEEQNKLWAVFEEKMQDLLVRCRQQQAEIKDLSSKLKREQTNVAQLSEELQAWKTKYTDLLTAHVVSVNDGNDIKSARKRLSKLVREIDDCIEYITLSKE